MYHFIIVICIIVSGLSCKREKGSINFNMARNQHKDSLVKSIARYGIFRYEGDGSMKITSSQCIQYIELLSQCSEKDLMQLSDHHNPIVRCYGFYALVKSNSSQIFNILLAHLRDTSEIRVSFGDFIDDEYVCDFFLEQVGYFANQSTYCLNATQKSQVDSIIFWGEEIKKRTRQVSKVDLGHYDHHPEIRSRLYMLKDMQPKPGDRGRLKELVESNVNEALPVLAKLQDPNDLSFILKIHQIDEHWILREHIYKAVYFFPHPSLFFIIKDDVQNNIDHNGFFHFTISEAYRSLSKYKTQVAKELFRKALADTSKDHLDTSFNRTKFIKTILSRDSSKYFDDLIKRM